MSRRRRSQGRWSAPPPPLAVLDLSNPFERQAHEFLRRATSKCDQMWKLYNLQRQGAVLLCVVEWVHPEGAVQAFSLAELSLTESAVRWQYYPSAESARAEMERCASAPVSGEEVTPTALR